jgi:hypothetical protein
MSRYSLICSAQVFGYGPCATLFSVVRALPQDVQCTLIMREGHNAFPHLNSGVFQRIMHLNADADLAGLVRREAPDAVLSVLDPEMILHGSQAGRPSYYIDSLFWFWSLRRPFGALRREARRAREHSRLSPTLTPHERIFLGHLLAEKSYVQRDTRMADRLSALAPDSRVQLVGALIASVFDSEAARQEHILVTTSGAVIPSVSAEASARYIALVVKLACQLARRHFQDVPWIVLVNPELLRLVHELLNCGDGCPVVVRASVGQEAMAELLTRAILVLTPPGLHSIYECAAAGVPALFLPEQSAQYQNAERLAGYGYPTYGESIHSLERNSSTGDPDGIEALYTDWIPRYLRATDRLLTPLSAACDGLKDERRRMNVALAQREAVLQMVGDFDGAAQVAADLSRELYDATGSGGSQRSSSSAAK